jgi:hypothetical protein
MNEARQPADAEPHAGGSPCSILRRAFHWLVLLTLVVAPTQWAFQPRPKMYVSPADFVLALTALVWLADNLLARDWKRMFRLPPWPHLLFVGIAAASVGVAADKSLAVKDIIQLVEYFIVGSMVFDAFLREGGASARRWALALSGIVCGAIIVTAAWQYGHGDLADNLTVRGTFGNRNVFGGYMAMALPLIFAGFFAIRFMPLRVAFALMFVAGFAVTLSGAAYWAAFVVVLALAACAGWRVFLPVAALMVFCQVWILPKLPRENDLAHFDSLALYEGDQVSRRYPDWQAAYNMSLSNPDLGVGLGNYQKNIGRYYDDIPRRTGPSEPDSQNLYLVILASCGVAALVAYLAVLFTGIGAAVGFGAKTVRDELPANEKKRDAPLDWDERPKKPWTTFTPSVWVSGGVAAALVAFAATCIWHPLLVRGIGLPFVFLLALARRLSDPEVEDGR